MPLHGLKQLVLLWVYSLQWQSVFIKLSLEFASVVSKLKTRGSPAWRLWNLPRNKVKRFPIILVLLNRYDPTYPCRRINSPLSINFRWMLLLQYQCMS